MGLTSNQQQLIKAVSENNMQLAKKCAIACVVEDTTQKNKWFCNKYKQILESSGSNMVLENVLDLYNQKLREDECCGTITANGNTSSTRCGTFGVVEKQYRIRKLTPLGG